MRIILAEYSGNDRLGNYQFYELSLHEENLALDVRTEICGDTYFEAYFGESITEILDLMESDTEEEGYDENARKELMKDIENLRKDYQKLSQMTTQLLKFQEGRFR